MNFSQEMNTDMEKNTTGNTEGNIAENTTASTTAQGASAQELPPKTDIELSAEHFLGESSGYVPNESLKSIIKEAETFAEKYSSDREEVGGNKKVVSYDKRKSAFLIDGEVFSAGQIMASRHMGAEIVLPSELDASGIGRRFRKNYTAKYVEDFLVDKLNHELAVNLSEVMQRKDTMKASAYKAIAERTGNKSDNEIEKQNEQLGVVAERIMHGVAEMVAIDREDFGITVSHANAYQDVEEKVDFIIASKQKRRGVGVDSADLPAEEKSIGVQFTINTEKEGFKKEQIAKAKERGIHLDDIVYVSVDSAMLRKAINLWKEKGSPISGPWAQLPKETQKTALQKLFHSVLTEEQEKSLLKNY